LRQYFEEYGVTRMHCPPSGARASLHKYKEAWIEFSNKEAAKRVVITFNNQPLAPKNIGSKTLCG